MNRSKQFLAETNVEDVNLAVKELSKWLEKNLYVSAPQLKYIDRQTFNLPLGRNWYDALVQSAKMVVMLKADNKFMTAYIYIECHYNDKILNTNKEDLTIILNYSFESKLWK